MNATNLLNRFGKVRQTGAGKWLACCPAHEDRSPSLSVKQTDDGKILLHCFGGCSVTDIVAVINLQLADLMPERQGYDRAKSRIPKFNKTELFDRVVFESIILRMAVSQLLSGVSLSKEDLARVEQAGSVIDDLAKEVRL